MVVFALHRAKKTFGCYRAAAFTSRPEAHRARSPTLPPLLPALSMKKRPILGDRWGVRMTPYHPNTKKNAVLGLVSTRPKVFTWLQGHVNIGFLFGEVGVM